MNGIERAIEVVERRAESHKVNCAKARSEMRGVTADLFYELGDECAVILNALRAITPSDEEARPKAADYLDAMQDHEPDVPSAARAVRAARPKSDEEARLREALGELTVTAKLLLANAHGCAQHHHSVDYQEQGLPGWLADCEASISKAAALSGDKTP